MVQVGDSIPSVLLQENDPGTNVDLSKELAAGKGLIIGVPAAFSPTCSDSHIPEYISHPALSTAGKIFVVSVNDAFVTKAWGKSLDKEGASGIRFLADSKGSFSTEWDVLFDATAVLGNKRSKRYTIKTKDGKVTSVKIEEDNVGLSVSSAKENLN